MHTQISDAMKKKGINYSITYYSYYILFYLLSSPAQCHANMELMG